MRIPLTVSAGKKRVGEHLKYHIQQEVKLPSLAGLAVHREKSRSCSGESTMVLSVMKVAYL